MPDGRHNRYRRTEDLPGQSFIVERSHIFQRAAAPGNDNDIDIAVIMQIAQCLNNFRRRFATLHRGSSWLGDAQLGFAEIAERLGFADVSAFYRAFRKWTGSNPGHYRSLILQTPIGRNAQAD